MPIICYYLYMKYGAKVNDNDIYKLQMYLIDHESKNGGSIPQLCDELKKLGIYEDRALNDKLGENYKSLEDYLRVNIPHLLLPYKKVQNTSDRNRCIILMVLSKCTFEYVTNRPDFSELINNKYFIRNYLLPLFRDYGASKDFILDAIFSSFAILVEYKDVSVKGDIGYCIKKYKENMLPRADVYFDYADMLQLDPNSYSVNIYKDLCEYRHQEYIPGAFAKEASILEGQLTKLKKCNPRDVIKSVFYYKENDSAVESLMLQIFENYDRSNNVAVLNPSPFMVDYLKNERTTYNFFVKEDLFFGYLNSFTLFDKSKNRYCHRLGDMNEFSESAIIYCDSSFTFANAVDWLDTTQVNFAVALVPYNFLSSFADGSKKSDFKHWSSIARERMKSSSFGISHIYLLPSSVVGTTPAKRCLLILDKHKKNITHIWNTVNVIESNDKYSIKKDKKAYVYIEQDDSAIARDEIFDFRTIKMAFDSQKKEKPTTSYNTASVYNYSDEIKLKYRYVKRKKTGESIAIKYSEIRRNKAPKKIVGEIDRVLKDGKQPDDILGELVYSDIFYKAIVDDVKKYYDKDFNTFDGDDANSWDYCSFKTAWFVFRKKLNDKSRYNDDIAKVIFDSDEMNAFGKMTIRSFDGDIVNEMLEKDYDWISKRKLVEQLRTIFTSLGKELFSHNPMQKYLARATTRLSEEQFEVRSAYVKRQLSLDEQKKLLSQDRYEELEQEKNYLITETKLFTGISTKELCALKWSDVDRLTHYGLYYVLVYKYVEYDSHKYVDNPVNKIRKIPLVKHLAERILNWKNQLMKINKLDNGEIARYPIFPRNVKLKSEYENEIINPRDVAKILTDMRDSLDISSDILTLPSDTGEDIESDVNAYSADIFVSNFRHHANHTALTDLGGINYMAGVAAPDTLTEHYFDYSSDAALYVLYVHLERWAKAVINDKSICDFVECIITPKSDKTKVSVEIDAQYGAKVTVEYDDEVEG